MLPQAVNSPALSENKHLPYTCEGYGVPFHATMNIKDEMDGHHWATSGTLSAIASEHARGWIHHSNSV